MPDCESHKHFEAAGSILNRDILEDITIEVEHPRLERIPMTKGSQIIVDMVGVRTYFCLFPNNDSDDIKTLFADHDPRVFPDPESFKPSRWYGVSEQNLSMFGIGPRSCIGRKFAQVEALTFLALFLRDWKVDVALGPGETRAQYRERVMEQATMIGLAFGVKSIPLRISKRVVQRVI